jgi:hypothetical protein
VDLTLHQHSQVFQALYPLQELSCERFFTLRNSILKNEFHKEVFISRVQVYKTSRESRVIKDE